MGGLLGGVSSVLSPRPVSPGINSCYSAEQEVGGQLQRGQQMVQIRRTTVP